MIIRHLDPLGQASGQDPRGHSAFAAALVV